MIPCCPPFHASYNRQEGIDAYWPQECTRGGEKQLWRALTGR